VACLLVDANLAPAVAVSLRRAGHDAVHVSEVGMAAAPDIAILQRAVAEQRSIVTFDLDFVHLLAVGGLAQPSLILVRMRSARTADVVARLTAVLVREAAILERSAIVTVDEHKLRVHELPLRRASPG
jgi:predicted nuclease of predicted toxin-antitoxin system